MYSFEKIYQEAHVSGLLPGVALVATDRDGRSFMFGNSIGVRSLEDRQPMRVDSVLALASCTKLITAIAVMQCVEKGQLDLDADVEPILPEAGKYGIITGFNDEINQAILEPKASAITLRNLLNHTSGQSYDSVDPHLLKWRASRNESPLSAPSVVDKSSVPLVFQPGSSWMYGGGIDWAGKIVERATGQTLEEYMKANIWGPLGIKDLTFWPKRRSDMQGRLATISLLDNSGVAVPAPGFSITDAVEDCLGGGGAYGTAEAYLKFLRAVMNQDPKILNSASYTELFKPQLNDHNKKVLNDMMRDNQTMYDFIGMNIPKSAVRNWTFAGVVVEGAQEGWLSKDTIMWGGISCCVWFIDREAGLCGFAGSQVMPPMARPVMQLHGNFQRGIYDVFRAFKHTS